MSETKKKQKPLDEKQRPKKVMPVSPGRPKGVPNKVTKELRTMIRDALDKAGGVTYLTKQANENPKAFLSLLGRTLPLEVTGEGGGALIVQLTPIDAAL